MTLPKTVSPQTASKRSFQMLAYTDPIARTARLSYEYAKELITVDPDAPIEDDCLVVVSISKASMPSVARLTFRGRDYDGRFVKRGSPTDTVMTHHGWYFSLNEEDVRIFGRLVSFVRHFPRLLPEDEECSS